MNLPVFEHTVSALRAIIQNENEPLQKVSDLLKYDPGLYFALIKHINLTTKRGDVTSISQAISLIGSEGTENFIIRRDHYLDNDFLIFWCYAVIAGETAVRISERADIEVTNEEAFFVGILPSVGMLLMLITNPNYKKIMELLFKIPVEQRVYIEEGLYKTNHIEQLNNSLSSPKIYRDVIDLMFNVFTKDGHRKKIADFTSKMSVAHKSLQMFKLIDTAEAAARALLFPAVVEAQEHFREMAKSYFRIPENEVEELLADVLERFEAACKEFKVEGLRDRCILSAESYVSPGLTFLTQSKVLKKSVEDIYAANKEDKNILIYGESSVGKRLLAIALHHRPDNPRRNEPFISVHCAWFDGDTFEMEMCGTKGCFLGMEKHKGALEIADRGTVLLKDIDLIPMIQQDLLADMLGKDKSHKIGETQPAAFNIKFILTSRKNIITEAKEGKFSEKLLSVINPIGIYIPSFRERREDIEFIADAIIKKYGLKLADPALKLGLREYYETQAFPDNLRDLKRFLFFLAAKHSLKS